MMKRDEPCGVILIPLTPEVEWFHQIFYVSFPWSDLSSDEPIFEDIWGKILPRLQEIFCRICFFDAFGISVRGAEKTW